MNLALFIHDLFLEVGHGRAIIEKLSNLPGNQKVNLKVICFTCDEPQNILPERFNVEVVQFPLLKRPSPFLLKAFLFHIFCFIYSSFFLSKKFIRIGIGIASLNCDIVETPFLHQQYEKIYFSTSLPFHKLIYKKILFAYYRICENILYRSKVRVFTVSKFMKDYLKKNFSKDSNVIYHGVNTSHFPEKLLSKKESIAELRNEFPSLKNLDLDQEIFLFIGALERKGISSVLELLSKKDHYQLIVIGESEDEIDFSKHSNGKIVHINYTNKISYFYQLADSFIFPTLYEPFGLVLTEAAWMGLKVYTTGKYVGAYELIEGLKGIYSLDQNRSLENPGMLSLEEKQSMAKDRRDKLSQFSWSRAGQEFENELNQFF